MPKGSRGSVVQIIGTVVDLEFPADNLPDIYNAVNIDIAPGKILVAEV